MLKEQLEQMINEWVKIKEAALIRLQNLVAGMGLQHIEYYEKARDLLLRTLVIDITPLITAEEIKAKLKDLNINRIELHCEYSTNCPPLYQVTILVNGKTKGTILYQKPNIVKLSQDFSTSFYLSIVTFIIIHYEDQIKHKHLEIIKEDVKDSLDIAKYLLKDKLNELLQEAEICKLAMEENI